MIERRGEYIWQTPEYMKWYEENGFARFQGDHIQLLDPMTREGLPAGEFPECVEDDPMCRAGIEVLKSLPERDISVNLVFNYHRGLQDYQALVEKVGPLLKEAAVVGLEWNIGEKASIPACLSDISWEHIAEDNTTMGSYIKALREYVGEDRAVPCDIDYPIGKKGTLRHRLDDVYEYSLPEIGNDDVMERRRAEVGYMEWQAVRHPMMLAAFGYGIGLRDMEETIPDGSSVVFVVGSAHAAAMPTRLENIGISSQIHTVKASERDTDLFTQTTLNGRFSLKELEKATR